MTSATAGTPPVSPVSLVSGGRPAFPFTAVVGMDDLGLALALAAVSPEIGGVLARGEKGTAKSTMVRALAAGLPEIVVVDGCRFACAPTDPDSACPDGPHVGDVLSSTRPTRLVELPVGAAEERLTGSLHLDRLLTAGQVAYDPGLLASANRGVLYVDEVNLLPDHLVDLLLDAAAMGRATVEREGASLSHAARFLLVGTMNPEEGELRPQLLDRFGLAVDVRASRDPEVRVEVMERRLAYEADPAGFAASYADAERELVARIVRARVLLPAVKLGREAMLRIAEICTRVDVDGMRADLVMARAAVAHAAWSGRDEVGSEDLRVAARLALPHRQRRNPFDDTGSAQDLEDLLDEVLPESDDDPDHDPDNDPNNDPDGDGGGGGQDDGETEGPPTDPHPPAADRLDSESLDSTPEISGAKSNDSESSPPAQADGDARRGASAPNRTSGERAGATYRTRVLQASRRGPGVSGRRGQAETTSGRQLRVVAADDPRGTGLAATATVVASRLRTATERAGEAPRRPTIVAADLRRSRRRGKEGNLVVFAVDTSGSMGAAARVREVKTACLSLLLDAYQRRDKVAVVTFARDRADVVLPPTSSVTRADRALREVATGGRTPLAEGLATAGRLIARERLRDPLRRPLLVVLTDGRGTFGSDPLVRAHRTAAALSASEVAAVVVDCENRRGLRLGLAKALARQLRADYLELDALAADGLAGAVHGAVAEGADQRHAVRRVS